MNIDLIGFDADDTLWHTEIHYLQAQEDFKGLLSPWASPERTDELMHASILDNLPRYGYGIKAFVLSLVEAAIEISDGKIGAVQIEQILSIGKRMLTAEVVLKPHVRETLQSLRSAYPMMIITKGDLLDQTTKVKRTGIGDFFTHVEVVNEKSPEAYAQIFEQHRIHPGHFLMVGNTLRSDIQPVLALGGAAVHIPADSTWAHELMPGFDTAQNGFYALDHMGQLPALISKITDAA